MTQQTAVFYFRLIGDFAEKCKSDIEGSNCGRISQQIHSDNEDILVQHSQVPFFLIHSQRLCSI